MYKEYIWVIFFFFDLPYEVLVYPFGFRDIILKNVDLNPKIIEELSSLFSLDSF